MKKYALIAVLLTLFLQMQVFAESIDSTIRNSGINKGGISVSVKELVSGKTVYKFNDDKPSMPASTLKLVTLVASLDTLGKDYEFSTKLYKNTNNEMFIQLGADPFLTSAGLNALLQKAKDKKFIEPKMIYIDDYIFDSTEWGEGWQWDDELNPLMPRFSSYNIDKNLLTIVINPTSIGAPASIRTTKFYPVTFMNLVTTGNENNVEISKNNTISADIITVEGIIQKQIMRQIPVNYPKRYFLLRLEDAIHSAKIDYYGQFAQKKTTKTNTYLVGEVTHTIDMAIEEVLKYSNNFVAETVFKLAGAKFVDNTGSLANSQKMIKAYLEKNGLNIEHIKIVDGSGVSKNNIVTADFMSQFLVQQAKTEGFISLLPTAGEGTLNNRMLYFKDNLHAKTGTLSDVSSIAGYITSRSGNTYAFDIMINDSKSKSYEKKSLEEYIIRDIYTNY